MKRRTIIVVLVLIMLIIFSCLLLQKYSENLGEKSDVEVIDTSDLIEIYVLEDTITSTGLTYCVKNIGGSRVCFGEPYSLERFRMGNWYKVPTLSDTIAYTAIEYIISQEEEQQYSVNWHHVYGKLPKGKYRLVKKMRKDADFTKGYAFEVAAEFEVKTEDMDWDDFIKINGITYIGDWRETEIPADIVGEKIGEVSRGVPNVYTNAIGKLMNTTPKDGTAFYCEIGTELFAVKDNTNLIAALVDGKYYLYFAVSKE